MKQPTWDDLVELARPVSDSELYLDAMMLRDSGGRGLEVVREHFPGWVVLEMERRERRRELAAVLIEAALHSLSGVVDEQLTGERRGRLRELLESLRGEYERNEAGFVERGARDPGGGGEDG